MLSRNGDVVMSRSSNSVKIMGKTGVPLRNFIVEMSLKKVQAKIMSDVRSNGSVWSTLRSHGETVSS